MRMRFFDFADAPLRMTGSACHSEPCEESTVIRFFDFADAPLRMTGREGVYTANVSIETYVAKLVLLNKVTKLNSHKNF